MIYIGNHGMAELKDGKSSINASVRGYLPLLRKVITEIADLAEVPGVRIEDKFVSLAIHYRNSVNHEQSRRLIAEKLTASPAASRLKIVPGRLVYDLLPPVNINKGTAVTNLITRFRLDSAIYMGDDTTDIDAFRAVHQARLDNGFRGLAIGVTNTETPLEIARNCDYTLADTEEVTAFLKWLSEVSPKPTG